MGRTVSTSRNKNGKPRKLRKVTNLRAARRQARKIAGFLRGRKLTSKELVHHKRGAKNNSPSNLKIMSGRRSHGGIHPGKTGSGKG